MTTNRVPYSETAKAVQAARPPAGPAPSTRAFLRGLREVPPLSVVLAGLVMALPVLGLLVAAVVVVRHGFSLGVGQGLVLSLLAVVLVVLAAMGWRGLKRTVHLGEYDDGLFLARLSLFPLPVFGLAVLVLALQGRSIPWTVALVPAAVVVLFLPQLFLITPAAKAWPDRVLLRRGTRVSDADEAALLPGLRPHTCGAFGHAFPAQPVEVTPMNDLHRSGWRVGYTCWKCGEAAEQLGVAVRAGESSGLGASDLWWLGEQADQVCQSAPTEVDGRMVVHPLAPATLDDDPLAWCVMAQRGGVRATEQLLALVPEGGDKVPGMRTAGRTVPLDQVTTAFQRDTVEKALSRRRGWLASYEAEMQRRVAGVPPVGA